MRPVKECLSVAVKVLCSMKLSFVSSDSQVDGLQYKTGGLYFSAFSLAICILKFIRS